MATASTGPNRPQASRAPDPPTTASAPRGLLRFVLGVLLTFVGALTFGNAPYAVLGYGISMFAVFVLGLSLRPRDAVIAVFLGMTLGVAVDLKAASLFAFVGVGAIIVRTAQIALLVRLRPRLGDLSAMLLPLLLGTFVPIALGVALFGGEGLMPAFAIFDVLYILPAWLIARILATESRPTARTANVVLVAAATLVMFASGAAFFLPAPFFASILVLGFVAFTRARRRSPSPILGGGSGADAVPLAIVAVLVALFLVSGAALGPSMRALAYPLYPDSLAGSQWTQTSTAAGCRPGDLAGGRSEENGVWGPARLRVLSTCVTVPGVMETIIPTYGTGVDRDYSFDLRVDPGYEWTLSFGSYILNGGELHVEVVPSDQAAVLGNLTLVPGAHVSVTGAWVLDADHGWYSEVHPTWSIVVLP